MKHRKAPFFFCLLGATALAIAVIAQQQVTEALAGFTTPTLGQTIGTTGEFIHSATSLLHDVGTGDGIVQVGPQDTADKLRTPPLWGLHIESRFMHDLKSLTLEDAIGRHAGEAHDVVKGFHELTPKKQRQTITFLKSL